MSWGSGYPVELDVCRRSYPMGGATYNTQRWKPDIVVVDMGRNDGHTCCAAQYHSFMRWLQSAYGQDIAVVICSEDDAPFYRSVYDQEKAQGSNVFLWTDFLSSDLGQMVLGHPSKAAHERYAKKLEYFLESEVLPKIGRNGTILV